MSPIALLRSWAGALVPTRWTLGAVIREPFAGAWQMNRSCNDPSLLTFSGVYACITIIASDVAKLGLYLYKRLEDGTRELAPKHPITGLLRRPNDFQTLLELLQCFVIALLACGNAYLLKRRDARGVVNALYVLDPRAVWPIIADDGSIFYQLGGDMRLAGVPDGAKSVIVPAREIVHHRINAIAHPLIGTSPLIAAAMSAGVGLNIIQNSAALFGNMSRPGGIITAPGKLSEPMATRLKAEWKKNYGAANLGEIAVLAEGLKFDATGVVNAVDAQLIEQLRWSVEDVARVFRVPGFMLGDLSKVTYRNSEQLQRTYYSGCLQFHLEALEARLHEGLELDDQHFVEFDLDNLLRTEIDVRFDAYQKAIQSGVYTINDARKREDLAPVKGGDEPLVQAQYRPLSAAIAEAEASALKAKRDATQPSTAPAPLPEPDDEDLDDEDSKALARELIEGLQRYVRPIQPPT